MKNANGAGRKWRVCDWREEGTVGMAGHGHAYFDFMTRRARTWVWPLNEVVALWMRFTYLWDRVRYRRNWVDKQVLALLKRDADGYDAKVRALEDEREGLKRQRQELECLTDRVVKVWGDGQGLRTLAVTVSDAARRDERVPGELLEWAIGRLRAEWRRLDEEQEMNRR